MPETINWHLVSVTVRDKSDAKLTSEYYLSDNEYQNLLEMRDLRQVGRITTDRYVFVYAAALLSPTISGTRSIHLPSIVEINSSPAPDFEPPAAYDKIRRKTTRDRLAQS
jgi:hypothetical protein